MVESPGSARRTALLSNVVYRDAIIRRFRSRTSSVDSCRWRSRTVVVPSRRLKLARRCHVSVAVLLTDEAAGGDETRITADRTGGEGKRPPSQHHSIDGTAAVTTARRGGGFRAIFGGVGRVEGVRASGRRSTVHRGLSIAGISKTLTTTPAARRVSVAYSAQSRCSSASCFGDESTCLLS